uniref:Zinc finger, CCHC-type n=1 Tax=Tanacetum cinerariifolium TaxID=118510 RepID=A0A699H563_TANCI|nr:zinc finger, CCHC-type [Tanacetum cinerariifolium]
MTGDDTTNTLKPVTPIAQYQCPKLKTTNYTVWAIQIKVILEAHDLWEAIEPKKNTQVDDKKDKATIAFLYQALTEDVILQVAGCETAKELWESLKKRHVGEEKVQQARLQSLMIGFQTLQMKEDDTVDAFTAKRNGYATKAKELGKTLDESLLVRKLLDSTPDRGTSTTPEQSNLILEDDESSLLMTTHEIEHEEFLLNEGQIQPGKYASADASIWYLDNGASNHMTGTKSHFRDINERITGRIRFGDGSYVQIKGRGSILLGCKNNEQKIVSDVYYIPNLKSNIISLGQLTEIGLLANVDNQAWLWHARLGHLNFDDINKMTRKGLVEGIPRINHAGQICDACLLEKHNRTPFPNQAKFRSKNSLDLVYGDFCTPISPATHFGKKFIFLLVDDCTRFMWAYFLTSKDQTFSTFKEFRQRIEMEMRIKLRMLRTDRGAPYSPQQNRVLERRNRTVLSTTRSMMKAMKLPLTFWAEAVKHAIYILNRVPTRALVDKTPYEALYNRKPNLENLRIFRCTAYAKITIPHLKKIDDRIIPMIYLGVEEGSKACRLYDPIAKKKHVSRDVKFMETKPWDWDKNGEDTNTQDTIWTSFVDPITDLDSPVTPPAYTYNPNSEEKEKATICSLRNSKDRFDDTPVRGFKVLTERYQNAREVETETLLFTKEEPYNYKEASTDKKWIEAIEIELDSINKKNTWTLTTLPINQKAIGLKWVYKAKRDAKGKIIKYKARLVAKCYVQEQRIDFDEVFAPVARIETVRLILALAAYHSWQVHHLDVKLAFLHGDLKEEVYVTQPEGFIQQGNSGKVYKLTKALYGLRQAPRAWNMKLDQTLKSLDFKKCNLEQAVYTKRSKTSTLIVGVYVDDLIITGTPRKELEIYARPEESSPEGSEASNPIHQRNKGTWHNIHKKKAAARLQKQPTVALSSCKSEFMVATGAACQALWLKRLLSELTGCEEKRITLKVDNISAIALVRNPVFHGRSKHIDIHYHFIRECVENGHINVEHVSGELQRAHILTKALPRLKFVTMRQMLGVQDLGQSNDQD